MNYYKDKNIVIESIMSLYNECINVKKLDRELTREHVSKLLDKYTPSQITKALKDMENYKQLAKKYTSAYITLQKWIELDIKNQNTNKYI